MRSSDDLNTRARIRDAALVLFGEEGFGVGVRAIAAAAGVSPGLVNHHFGSKEGLRRECDDHVRAVIRESKMSYMNRPSPGNTLQQLAEIEEFAPFIAYIMRSFQAGGDLAASLFEHMVEDVEQYLEAGVASGALRRPRDLKAMARYLATTNGGGMLLFIQMHAGPSGAVDYRQALREYGDQMLLPAVEVMTEGLLPDSTMLETLLADAASRAGGATGTEARPQSDTPDATSGDAAGSPEASIPHPPETPLPAPTAGNAN
ncbi:TetR/AcrR family transcriptional regulator [Nocardia jinanensis]|uniref:TetR family transcriptional regulator n=1 Tax=Nocardia jinanensis TaxID=382504 RepID=A0A917VXJ0_9NOCA|nr:TetR family transcriptional regulator [Nocardia jinanensis]GGL29614.1 TetR family transcriptional regulator [Nocardia jinanensis]